MNDPTEAGRFLMPSLRRLGFAWSASVSVLFCTSLYLFVYSGEGALEAGVFGIFFIAIIVSLITDFRGRKNDVRQRMRAFIGTCVVKGKGSIESSTLQPGDVRNQSFIVII